MTGDYLHPVLSGNQNFKSKSCFRLVNRHFCHLDTEVSQNGSSMTRHVDRPVPGNVPEGIPSINYGGWLWLVFCWDGLLPMLVLSIPQLALKSGADRGTSEALAILTPIIAFFVRLCIGIRKLSRNHCGPILQVFQFAVFFLAAILLVCIDSLMVLSMEMNDGEFWTNPGDMIVMFALLAVYFSAMLFAFYPGRTLEPSSETDSESDDTWLDWQHNSTTDDRY